MHCIQHIYLILYGAGELHHRRRGGLRIGAGLGLGARVVQVFEASFLAVEHERIERLLVDATFHTNDGSHFKRGARVQRWGGTVFGRGGRDAAARGVRIVQGVKALCLDNRRGYV